MTTPEPDFRPVTMNTPGHIWSNVNFIFYLPSDSIYKKRFIYDHIQPLRDFTPLSDLLEGFWINRHPLKDVLYKTYI